MKRLLIVTNLDFRYYDNNRVHHIVNQLQKRIEEVFLIYKVNIHDKCSNVNKFQAFLTLKTKCFRNENFTSIEVNPVPNHIGGLGLSILKLSNPYTVPSSYFKRLLRKFMSLLGFVSDLGLLPSFFIAYLIHIRKKIDIFLGQGPWEVAFGLLLRRLGLVRMIVYDDFDYAPGYQQISKIRRRIVAHLEKMCLKKADLIVSVGDLLGGLREEQTGRKVTVIPNGVNLPLFQSAQYKVLHPPTLIYTGFVSGWAGLELIFNALQKVKKQFPNIRFLVLGHANLSYIEGLMNLRDEMELREHVFYLGKKPYREIVPYLKEGDIGMAVFRPVDLRKYAFSLKVIEYIAAGLPVITTKGTQSEDVVRKHDCGIAVDYSAEEVADALIQMLINKNWYSQLSENAKKAAEKYNWEELMEKYFNIIENSYNKKYQKKK